MNGEESKRLASEVVSRLSARQRCGQILVVGFDGPHLPPSLERELGRGHRGGVILFRRNLSTLEATAELCGKINAACGPELAPLVGIDEEGGRVTRLPPPFRPLPPMRWVGEMGDPELAYRLGSLLAEQLRALGITCDFAPVLDVDSNPNNPIIGDRSFSRSAWRVSELGLAFARGLTDGGIVACGKHFPGHGDTVIDSHLGLPIVEHALERLERIELVPFREAAKAKLPSLMTAHIVFPALDPTRVPATLSRKILSDVLRGQLGFEGVVFSDDLEMRAIADTWTVPEAACRAVHAGCDAVLVCHSESAAELALDALEGAATADPFMARRVEDAATRFLAMRLQYGFTPSDEDRGGSLADITARTRVALDELISTSRARSGGETPEC